MKVPGRYYLEANHIRPLVFSGIFFGVLIPASLTLVGPVASYVGVMRAEISPVFLFFIIPVLFIVAGIVAIRFSPGECTHSTAAVRSCATGILTGIVAIAVFSFTTGLFQYHPFLAPGPVARLLFAFGMLIFYFIQPLIYVFILIFSMFSVVGGIIAASIWKRAEKRDKSTHSQ